MRARRARIPAHCASSRTREHRRTPPPRGMRRVARALRRRRAEVAGEALLSRKQQMTSLEFSADGATCFVRGKAHVSFH